MIIGVDVGGTFTDVFFLDEASQKIEIAKVPSLQRTLPGVFFKGWGPTQKTGPGFGRWCTEPPSARMPC